MSFTEPSGVATYGELTRAALLGERIAWNQLVERLQRVAWKAVLRFDMSEEDRKDAFAATFYKLFESLRTIREPDKLPGWIATTARNEALSVLRSRKRMVLQADVPEQHNSAESDDRLLSGELLVALRAAFLHLSPKCQELLRLLTADPPLSYAEISTLIDIPIGSIGVTRQRCLEKLRATPEIQAFTNGGEV